MKTICENRLICYGSADNAAFTTTLSFLPQSLFVLVKTGEVYSMATDENVKTAEASDINRLRDEYVKAVGAVEETERAMRRAQTAYDEACQRRNDAQAAFIEKRFAKRG